MPAPPSTCRTRPQALINLCYWSGSGDADEARDLIARGINIDEQDELQQMTALHYAAMYNRIEIVQELVRAGAALDVQDDDQQTALQMAQEEGYVEIAAVLEEAEAVEAAAVNESNGGGE